MIIGYDYEVFEDKGISGKNIEKRPELQKILKRLNEFDIVLVWKLSRLSRSVRDFANMLYEFDKNKVRFISYNEKIDTQDASGKLLMYVISIVAEIERDNISENIKLAKRQEFENGKITARKVLGYDIINKQLVINKKEANIIKFIFETYNKTHNYYKTARNNRKAVCVPPLQCHHILRCSPRAYSLQTTSLIQRSRFPPRCNG